MLVAAEPYLAKASAALGDTLFPAASLAEGFRQDFDAAGSILDKMETQFPHDQGVHLTRAVLLGRMRRYDDALALLDGSGDDKGRLGPNELLEKGRLLDQVGRYDDAWSAFAEGKKLLGEKKKINYEGASSRLDFDKYGDVTPDFGVFVVEKGQLVRRDVISI